MAHTLPELPYAYDALEPYVDELTLRIHHGKHHNTYVGNLNTALESEPDLANLTIEQLMGQVANLPESIRTAVRNNGGQHYNHSLYWLSMAPAADAGGEPPAPIEDAITAAFGSFAKFKEIFAKTAATCFGSGWAWLYVGTDGKLAVCSTSNESNPFMAGKTDAAAKQILVVDVWEHAYYLKYQNRRAEYLDAWWNVVNWAAVAKRFASATQA